MVNYDETFFAIVRCTFIVAMLELVGSRYMDLGKMDVKTTFIYENLDEHIFIEQLEGIIDIEQGWFF